MSYIDEIKERATECMSTDECLFCSWFSGAWCDRKSFAMCVLEALKQIEARLDQVTRERDAAVKDMRSILGTGLCYVCKKKHMVLDETGAYICEVFDRSLNPDPTFCGQFEWRGVEVEG